MKLKLIRKFFTNKRMRAVLQRPGGDINSMYIDEVSIPNPNTDEVLLKVEAFALNRADILQRKGKYPPPKHVTTILGLECSGYLVENEKINLEKKYMALLPGGAYAEYVTVNKKHLMPIPEGIDIIDAAAIPESWLTAYGLCKLANIKYNDYVLVHAAGSGVGTALIQLINYYKARSICLVGNEKKANFCYELGQGSIVHCINRNDKDKVKNIIHHSENLGCNAILDCVGAAEFLNNYICAGLDCKWIMYGLMGGSLINEIDLAKLMNKRINFHFTTLRNRSDEYKSRLIEDFSHEVLPMFSNGGMKPIIDHILNITSIKEAHDRMEKNINIGKIIIKWN